MSSVQSPGSFQDFEQTHSELLEHELLVGEYSSQLLQYREAIAQAADLTPEELHSMGGAAIKNMLDEEVPA